MSEIEPVPDVIPHLRDGTPQNGEVSERGEALN